MVGVSLRGRTVGGWRFGWEFAAIFCTAVFCAALSWAPGAIGGEPIEGPISPERALATFQLEEGLQAELVAAEPLVISPVAIAFDERGRAYVAENRGYPTGPGEGQPPAGRIAMLEDTDADGRLDKRTEFAEGLTFPNGVLPWEGGLVVTCSPDVLYLKDTDGDGKADVRQVWLTGFALTGSTQLRVSHPTLGPDGWIYFTSGLTGGKVVSPAKPDFPPVEIRRTDLRYEPRSGRFEAADGGAQFGLTFDDFGRRFICYNRVQVQHVVASSRYWRRNPRLAFADTVQNCPDELSPEPARGHGAAARIFPLSVNVTTADSHAGTFTAACGVLIWRGTGLSAAYQGCALSCDPTGNLVHFDRLVPQGATFAARRGREGVELLASPDSWFRPVFLAHGPEGALYVCDMYRKTIEHPDYLPVEVRKHTDFESGKDKGRIWRVVHKDADRAKLAALRRPDLSTSQPEELVRALSSDEAWRRDTAYRLLIERQDPSDSAALPVVVASGASSPATVAKALQLLAQRGELLDATLTAALRHEDGGVREQAVDLLEPRLAAQPVLVEKLLERVEDPASRVRFRIALALGEVPADSPASPRIMPALAKIAWRDASDRWARAAVLSSAAGREAELFDALRSESASGPFFAPAGELWHELGRLLGASVGPERWAEVIRKAVRDWPKVKFQDQAAFIAGLADSLRTRGASKTGAVLTDLASDSKFGDDDLRQGLASLVDQAQQIAVKNDAEDLDRRVALELLAHTDFATSGEALLTLVEAQQPSSVQSAAVRALGLMRDPRIAARLLEGRRFAAYTPKLREEVVSAVLSGSQHLPGLLDALESGAVPPNAVDSLRRRQLTGSKDASIQARAAKIFDVASAGNRTKVYEELKSVVGLKPDPANGRVVFRRVCAACHRLDRDGTPVGPDLFSIRNQPKEAILLHMIIPELEITPGFAAYVVTTVDGRVLTGLIAAETPTSVTLRQSLGKEETILRSDIEELVASKLSLMPQELEKTITRQEFADLLAYVKGEK